MTSCFGAQCCLLEGVCLDGNQKKMSLHIYPLLIRVQSILNIVICILYDFCQYEHHALGHLLQQVSGSWWPLSDLQSGFNLFSSAKLEIMCKSTCINTNTNIKQ